MSTSCLSVKLDALGNREPVEVLKDGSDVITGTAHQHDQEMYCGTRNHTGTHTITTPACCCHTSTTYDHIHCSSGTRLSLPDLTSQPLAATATQTMTDGNTDWSPALSEGGNESEIPPSPLPLFPHSIRLPRTATGLLVDITPCLLPQNLNTSPVIPITTPLPPRQASKPNPCVLTHETSIIASSELHGEGEVGPVVKPQNTNISTPPELHGEKEEDAEPAESDTNSPDRRATCIPESNVTTAESDCLETVE
ncbi:Hypothetical protein SMAX5B_017136 [Scophthalmus maximus]|uniref:Uncharacterized protein n=1 Tax=Scophthalmus maximus TaxID=52904 RepID=A0A2U9CMS0_SCOMX|nr:Hypothetical protein SMAX5B_017136 [Scophthalmus maximus]